MPANLKAIAEFLGAELRGGDAAEITGIASVASASEGDLVFAAEAKSLHAAMRSKAYAVITTPALAGTHSTKPLLLAPDPKLAFARAARIVLPPARKCGSVHPTAVVHQTAVLEKDVGLGAHVTIGENTRIGAGTTVGANSAIAESVTIGRDCRIAPNVIIYPKTKIADRVVIHAGAVLGSDGFGFVRDPATGKYEPFPQIGALIIEDDVEIGANSTIDRGALDETRICRGAKLDNMVHVGHNVRIGEDVVIAAQTGISGSSTVARNATLGGQVGVADHVTIEEGAIIGAQAGIPSNKTIRGQGVVFWGTPARPIKQVLKELASLARLARGK